MNENRFRVFKFPDVNKFGVSDDIVEVTVAFCDKKWEADYLCDLLNELHEENKRLKTKNRGLQSELEIRKADVDYANKISNELFDECKQYKKENEQLKSTIAQLIEQNRKNNDLLLSDIRILEKALWCSGCENDYGRLRELRKEFIR